MPSRIDPLVNGEYYHIYNRGVAKLPIFTGTNNYHRFLKGVSYYQVSGPKPSFSLFTPTTRKLELNNKIVEIVCYCLMPNHFHFLIKQLKDNGISEFVGKLSNSYTKYFNIKYKRVGPLYQGEFKSVLVKTNEQLIHLSRYIHLNPFAAGITKDLESYIWSSYPEYINKIEPDICKKEIILDQFKSVEDYKKFVQDHSGYAQELELIKHQVLDEDIYYV